MCICELVVFKVRLSHTSRCVRQLRRQRQEAETGNLQPLQLLQQIKGSKAITVLKLGRAGGLSS